MSDIKMCSHQCDCDCHSEPGIIHIVSCCDLCAICGRNIAHGEMNRHLAACHKGAANVLGEKNKKGGRLKCSTKNLF